MCWAAAAANAISYTGWSDESPETVFGQIQQNISGDRSGWVYEGLALFAKSYLENPREFFRHVKMIPPSFLWLCSGMRSLEACTLLSLRHSYFQPGHVITAYDATLNGDYDSNDIRSVNTLICTDSDDRRTGTIDVSLSFDPREKRLKTDYILNGQKSFILSAVILYSKRMGTPQTPEDAH